MSTHTTLVTKAHYFNRLKIMEKKWLQSLELKESKAIDALITSWEGWSGFVEAFHKESARSLADTMHIKGKTAIALAHLIDIEKEKASPQLNDLWERLDAAIITNDTLTLPPNVNWVFSF